MLHYFYIFILASAGAISGFFMARLLNRAMEERALQSIRGLYNLQREFAKLSEEIRECVFKSERKSVEFREQFIFYYKGIKDDLRSTLERLEKSEKPEEKPNDA